MTYDADRDTIKIVMPDGWRIEIDQVRIVELAALSPSALADLSLSSAGTAIKLDAEDIHISLDGPLATILPVKALARRATRQKGRLSRVPVDKTV